MAPHSSTLAWKIPWTEEPGGLQSMGSLRVGHDWVTSLSLFTFMHWRRKWQPTPVLLPGESRGWGSSGMPSMGSHRVGHDWSELAAAAVYISQWYSFNPSSPLLLPLCPQVCYLCLCLYCCPEYRFTSVTFSKFHIYMMTYMFYSFWHTSVYVTGSRFPHVTRTDLNLSF